MEEIEDQPHDPLLEIESKLDQQKHSSHKSKTVKNFGYWKEWSLLVTIFNVVCLSFNLAILFYYTSTRSLSPLGQDLVYCMPSAHSNKGFYTNS